MHPLPWLCNLISNYLHTYMNLPVAFEARSGVQSALGQIQWCSEAWEPSGRRAPAADLLVV